MRKIDLEFENQLVNGHVENLELTETSEITKILEKALKNVIASSATENQNRY